MAKMKLDGKVAIVTGASRGIGSACLRELARRGARVVAVARHAPTVPAALSLEGDLTEAAFRRTVVPRTLDRLGRIDILINNAGVGLYGPSRAADPTLLRQMLELNFFTAHELAAEAVPVMAAQGSGSIVNVTSIAAQVPLPWMPLYSAGKAALQALTGALRMELAGSGIHVMSVLPGYVVTDFQSHVLAGEVPPRVRAARRAAITPEACARWIVQGVEAGKRTVYAPPAARFMELAYRWFPAVVESRLARWCEGGEQP